MSATYGFERYDGSNRSRCGQRLRKLGAAIGLWAVCAIGIYLIGPGDAPATLPAGGTLQSIAAPAANNLVAGGRS
ncbi:MAG: hypothetical protein IT530_02630 [Burkholderiales bacterium]|nr:hypothetical protein [Burkholderiales bacterium]